MNPYKSLPRALTSGEVARLCGVAPRSATKWIDTGRLRGWRLPGSQDRRVAPADLLTFLRDHGMPVPAALLAHDPAARVLAYGVEFGGACRPADPFLLGLALADPAPLLGCVLGDADGYGAARERALAARRFHPGCRLVLVLDASAAGELEGRLAEAAPGGGPLWDAGFAGPADPALVAAALRPVDDSSTEGGAR